LEYRKIISLKDGRECCIRNGRQEDGKAALENFILTHEETEFLLTYPEEITFTPEMEGNFLKAKAENPVEAELLAVVDGRVAGLAGVSRKGDAVKLRHRAEFGISIAKACWGLGLGRALTEACIDCARKAGYRQLELEVSADNEAALALYRKAGFSEYGRNPAGFLKKNGEYQELVLMRLDLQ
jgi:RimJ/RimL family protein N-acetyltransferase